MLVDDSSFFRSQLGRFLREAGFQVVSESDGARALAALTAAPAGTFVAVVSDVEMPTMDGHELARQIRAHAALRIQPCAELPRADGERLHVAAELRVREGERIGAFDQQGFGVAGSRHRFAKMRPAAA